MRLTFENRSTDNAQEETRGKSMSSSKDTAQASSRGDNWSLWVPASRWVDSFFIADLPQRQKTARLRPRVFSFSFLETHLFLWVWVLCLCMYVHLTHVFSALRSQKRALDITGLQVQVTVSCHVGAGDWSSLSLSHVSSRRFQWRKETMTGFPISTCKMISQEEVRNGA